MICPLKSLKDLTGELTSNPCLSLNVGWQLRPGWIVIREGPASLRLGATRFSCCDSISGQSDFPFSRSDAAAICTARGSMSMPVVCGRAGAHDRLLAPFGGVF